MSLEAWVSQRSQVSQEFCIHGSGCAEGWLHPRSESISKELFQRAQVICSLFAFQMLFQFLSHRENLTRSKTISFFHIYTEKKRDHLAPTVKDRKIWRVRDILVCLFAPSHREKNKTKGRDAWNDNLSPAESSACLSCHDGPSAKPSLWWLASSS